MRPSLVRAVSLYPFELPTNPHFVPEHALLLYVFLPLAVCCYAFVLLAPGMLAVLVTRGATTITDLLVRGFAVAFAMRWIMGVLVAGMLGHTWSFPSFFATHAGLTAILSAMLVHRVRSGTAPVWPGLPSIERRRIVWMAALVVTTAIALSPWLLWQDMIGDGLEILITGRSLAEFGMPRFPHPSGFQGLGLGIIATAFPVHWFAMLVGPFEAAARLPFLIYLPLLFAVLVELIEFRSPRRMKPSEEMALALALASYVVTMALNASYDAYAADIAAPAGTDSFAIFCMAATLLSLWRRETVWLLGFVLIGYFARPSELLLLLLLVAAVIAAPREERRGWLLRIAAAVLLCIAARILYQNLYVPWASGGMQAGYRGTSMIRRFQYLTFGDVQRFLFLLVPSGFVAAIALTLFRRQDPWARTITLVCAAYFVFFYVQAFVALHHFAPVMLLPLVVWWRLALRPNGFRYAAPLAAFGALAGVLLALPPHFDIYRAARAIGARTSFRIGDYGGSYPQLRNAMDGAAVLQNLFRSQSSIEDPATELALSNLGILHYATRFAPDTASADYIAQPEASLPPQGFINVATKEGRAVFVRDSSIWLRDKHAAPTTEFASRLYFVPATTRFSYLGIRRRNYDLNLGSLPFIWRFFQ
ncbi:MAG: hypothetical protein ACREMQ_15210 [Longimicrobiales bacterium]